VPFELYFDKPPAGHALEGARGGERARIQTFEFTSTEDGQHFIQRLEGFPDEVLERIAQQGTRICPSTVNHMLVIVRRDGRTTAYVNELTLHTMIRPSRPLSAGQSLTKNDIAELDSLDIGVPIPPDAGFIFVFSVRWRKGLIYDFTPLTPNASARQFDCASILGQAFCHVLFQERFALSDLDWQLLFRAKWFPFVGLRSDTIDVTISHIRMGWGIHTIIDRITEETRERLSTWLECWRGHPSLAAHVPIFATAVERFLQGDYVSCVSLVYPRIEGVLRTHHHGSGAPTKPKQGNLVKSAVSSKIETEKCLLLPRRFSEYLSEVYFADFNPVSSRIDVSRHSVSHGVASPEQFDQASAVIGLLVVSQLFHCLERSPMNSATTPLPED
jgi:hypothetical protein